MSKRIAPNTTYAVKLGILTNSFYDAECKANLFKSTPYYFFNHKPTKAILNGVANGRLIDMRGNIEAELKGEAAVTVVDEKMKAQVTALEKENQALRAQIVELTEKAEAVEPAKAEKKTAKKKGSDEE